MLLDPGKYRGRIADYGVTQSQGGQQHPTVFITFEVLGQYDLRTGELVPCDETTTRTYYKAITPKTLWWLGSDLKAIGYDRPGLKYLDPEVPGAADLFGREIEVVCEHDSFGDRVKEKWSIHHERTREKIGREGLARLDALYGDQIRRVLGNDDAAAPPPPATPTTDETIF